MTTRRIFDLETNGFLEAATMVHCATVVDLNTGAQWMYRSDRDGDFLDHLISDLDSVDEIVGHNIQAFDVRMIQKFRPQWVPKAKVVDTLILTKLIWPNIKEWDFGRLKKKPGSFPGQLVGRHSLEAWGHRLNMHKGDYAKDCKALGIDPWAAVNDEMVDYCATDGLVTAKLFALIQSKEYSPRAIELEHAVFMYCREQEENGVSFDEQGAVILTAKLSARREELSNDLRMRFGSWIRPLKARVWKRGSKTFVESPGGTTVNKSKAHGTRYGYLQYVAEGSEYTPIETVEFNPSSRDHLADRLVKLYGWQPTAYTETGKPQVDEEVLKHFEFPESAPVLEYLLVDKRIGQISEGKEGWLRYVKLGRIHGRIDPLGTVTGRCAHMKPNLGQVPAVGKPYGAECRALFGRGFFVGADAAGLELRMLAHYMAKYDGGAYAEVLLTGDIHWANVLSLGLMPPGTVRDSHDPKHKQARDWAKTWIYAFLYGAGDEKLGSVIGGGKSVGRKLKKQFLESLPALATLIDRVKSMAGGKGYLPGLDGRRLHVRSPHSALNTLLQAAGAIVMKLALVYWHQDMAARGYRRNVDYKQVLWVHDEFQAECTTQEIATACGQSIVFAIRQVQQGFDLRCPLDGEFKTGNNWKDTH